MTSISHGQEVSIPDSSPVFATGWPWLGCQSSHQIDRQSWRSLLASFLGSTSWANISSQSLVFSSEQQVSPGSMPPSY